MALLFPQHFGRCIRLLPVFLSLLSLSVPINSQPLQQGGELLQMTVQQYCIACHNDALQSGDLSFQTTDFSQIIRGHGDTPERLLAQLRSGRMPPADMPRPDSKTYAS